MSLQLILFFFGCLLPLMSAQGGGMAELKAITGDEPYSGVGNAPAPVPIPQGFWGRPRYSPVGWSGAMNPMLSASYNPYYGSYGGYDRFASQSYSPYEGAGSLPRAQEPFPSSPLLFGANLLSSLLTPPSHSQFGEFSAHPSRPPVPSRSPSAVFGQSPVDSPSSFPSSQSSLSLGGFYKGQGNQRIN